VTWDALAESYDAVAETYEARFRDELDAKPRDRELLARFAEHERDPVVEVGCGPGHIGLYSLIHVPRAGLSSVLAEFHRVLRPGGRIICSAHEGRGEVERDEFLDHSVPFVATLFELDELVAASRAAGLPVVLAERRAPYPSESSTFRLYLVAERPARVR
jgi:hypothetical protein